MIIMILFAHKLVSHVKIHEWQTNQPSIDVGAMERRLDGIEANLKTIQNLLCNEENKPTLQEVVKSLPQELMANVILYMSNVRGYLIFADRALV